nr:alpha/beta fold hydrolase [Mycobacterium yunnanensis]
MLLDVRADGAADDAHDRASRAMAARAALVANPETERRAARLSAALDDMVIDLHKMSATFVDGPDPIPLTWFRDAVTQAIADASNTQTQPDVEDLLETLQWAITSALSKRRAALGAPFDSDFRWQDTFARVGDVLDRRLGGSRSIGRAGKRAMTAAMRLGVRKRVMQTMAFAVGDIIVYTQHREQILDRVDAAVKDAARHGNVCLVGHSLGGVIGLDYCFSRHPVSNLATVGSQVGLFAEWGFFDMAPRDAHTGKLIPPLPVDTWINMYDPNDLLSFYAESCFTNVHDVLVNTRAPFPDSHSEYWRCEDVYAQLAALIP